jgi:small subunit ribosomal protein S18
MSDEMRQDNNFNNDRSESNDRSRQSSNFQRKPAKRAFFKKKECRLCKIKDKEIDYKDIDLIRRFTTEKGKIVPRRMSGNCAKCQRKIKNAIKRARNAALIPFTNV